MAKKDDERKRDADQVLQGIRIVLPGTQALMGFQFIAFFNPVFQSLPNDLKNLHFVMLLFTILCSICLIAPVAFQQIGEDGSATNRFLQYTRKMLSVAMFLLLLAIGGDIYVAGQAIGLGATFATVVAGAMFSVGIFLWYIYAYMRRRRNGLLQ
jgi:hypothetical protein